MPNFISIGETVAEMWRWRPSVILDF